MGLCKVGRLIKYIPQCVMTGFVDSLAIIIFMSQIKNALGGGFDHVCAGGSRDRHRLLVPADH